MAQAIIPLKDLVQAKTRLAGLLAPSERRALAQAMVEDVMAVLAHHAEISQITLVSDDPGAAMLAQHYGAQCWSEAALACHGLNPLMQSASERMLAGGAETLVILHGDLPLLTAVEISDALASQRQSGGLTIGCDLQGKGTNLLVFDEASMPQFCFGSDSCAGHAASARDAGVPVRILQRLGIAVDVDEPADLQLVMDHLHRNPGSNTAVLLHKSELGARLALALAAMSGQVNAVDTTYRGLLG
ncbi:MAG: 2-phospho-L-lactate guanylyltransferase [Halioglobus sp.]